MASFTIAGIDNEFAVSTGSNVGTGVDPDTSTFDNPPNGSRELRITTKDGDNDPRLFEPGDIYDVVWGGFEGGGTILDAVVVRSDQAPTGDGGIIVFEGLDANGAVAQVIWTPGFDLEGWYSDNYNPSMEPQFYTDDTQATYSHSFVCFASETRIDTPDGPRPVGSLVPGDLVLTADAGAVEVLWTGQQICPGADRDAPVVFDPGSIGNTRRLRLSQWHRVAVETPLAEYYFGTPEVLVPARALANGRDIRIMPCARICYVHVLLADHHILSAEGARCESLFLGDTAMDLLDRDPDLARVVARHTSKNLHSTAARPILKMSEAMLLVNVFMQVAGDTDLRIATP